MSQPVSLLAAALLSALVLTSPAEPQPDAPVAVTLRENIPYGSPADSELLLDIYSPADLGAPLHPAVLLIHGGSWSSLDKSTMSGMGKFLAHHGFVAFSVDYRLFHGTQNRWPAQLDDVQRAVRWVRANAPKYGVDPERIGSFGHSAGAQLAALLGMEDTRDNSDPTLAKYSSRVQAVVEVSGPTDLTTVGNDPDGLAFLANFFGTSHSKHQEVWRDASPAFQVSKHKNELAPFLIVHGSQDPDVPISQAQELFKKLKSAGATVSFVKVNDVHTFQTPEARRQLATETLAFFDRYLAASR
ncbi:MAG: alpha/beta hydrolase [Bryobacteraceae bacterium]